ncbi:GTP-binding protein sar1 [Leucogyrophana mollusca]|uniref:GTP-binding protein sar1 n=1 Tax=Leucogyrophana mollusca TaxID=85980 RepID=A0ACB8BBP7_9AGAM|nr:GTP-binding protein sar1 [Leucogyrophana mollusca]
MLVFDYVWNILAQLGLVHRSASILFLGLEEFIIGNIKFTAYDLGLCDRRGPSDEIPWRDHLPGVRGIVFVVDSADIDRHPNSRAMFDELLSIDEVSRLPILVLGNKIDAPSAVSVEELREQLGLQQTTGRQDGTSLNNARAIEVFMCSAKRRLGYGEGFRWFLQHL